MPPPPAGSIVGPTLVPPGETIAAAGDLEGSTSTRYPFPIGIEGGALGGTGCGGG
jgi:hypothetical protein